MEKLMQYIWQYRLLPPAACHTVSGERVTIIDPGMINRDSGPDFFNAKVMIGDRLWCGNIEMHVRASDWHRHGHHRDHAYDSVILHVVNQDDTPVTRPDGSPIPQMVLGCDPAFSDSYKSMVFRGDGNLPCTEEIKKTHPVYITDWLTSLAFERLYAKVEDVIALYHAKNSNWNETVYITLARGLGFHTNSQPFSLLASGTPLRHLLKHRDSPEAVEGLLFGQAGLLDPALPSFPSSCAYVARMKAEYDFLTKKFSIAPPEGIQWKTARMRPANFPHRRIATLAAMIEDGFRIGYRMFSVRTFEEAVSLFDIDIRGFWSRRYNFTSETAPSTKALSRSSAAVLVINVVIPLLYAYGDVCGIPDLQDTAIDILQNTPPESNSVIAPFLNAGLTCSSAFDSQAMIQLRRAYCEPRKCIYCRIGHKFLAAKAHASNSFKLL